LTADGISPNVCLQARFFEAVGILFLFLFLKVNLGIFGGFFEKGKFEI
jgi:hypothetical protein